MSLAQRMGVLAGTLSAILMVLIILQSAYQEAETETQGGEFAEGQIIVKLEEEATPADLAALNRRNDARTEEDLPLSDLNVVDLPSDLGVGEAVQRYGASPAVEYAEPDFCCSRPFSRTTLAIPSSTV